MAPFYGHTMISLVEKPGKLDEWRLVTWWIMKYGCQIFESFLKNDIFEKLIYSITRWHKNWKTIEPWELQARCIDWSMLEAD